MDLKSLSIVQMEAFVRSLGWPPYRSRQLLQWIYQKGAVKFSEMTNLSKADRRLLEERAVLSRLRSDQHLLSADGTEKLLFRLSDGQRIETVLIPGEETTEREQHPLSAPRNTGQAGRLTLCISTQAGCTLDCRFCLTGTMGLVRNLAAHEIVDQVLEVQRYLVHSSPVGAGTRESDRVEGPRFDGSGAAGVETRGAARTVTAADSVSRPWPRPNRTASLRYGRVTGPGSSPSLPSPTGQRLTNIVLMGMGEPLANYREVVEALSRLTHPQMAGISPHRITLSTAGLAPQIRRVGESGLKINLAVSLNATTDAVRNRIMPAIARLYPLKELIAVCRAYPLPPRRRLTFEYVLLSGVNDSEENARRLVRLVRGIQCKVNLIPFNEFPSAPYRRPADETVLRFQKILTEAGLSAFIRKSRGRDILAACGQLRTEVVGKALSML